MNRIKFDFKAYLFNAAQEQVERLLGGPKLSTFPVDETKNYAIIRADDVIYKRIGAAYLPQMASYVHEGRLIICINYTWDRTIPKHITNTLVYHEMAHWIPEVVNLRGIELELYCDRWAAIKVGHEQYKSALLYLHEHYPGMVQLKRIEAFLSKTDKKTITFQLAKLILRT